MRYDKAFKEEAVRLSDDVGVKEASNQLGIPYNTLTTWRKERKLRGPYAFVGSGNKFKPVSAKDQQSYDLEREVAELKRANEILKEALGFFAQGRKR